MLPNIILSLLSFMHTQTHMYTSSKSQLQVQWRDVPKNSVSIKQYMQDERDKAEEYRNIIVYRD